jgi:hypothetical protein
LTVEDWFGLGLGEFQFRDVADFDGGGFLEEGIALEIG